MKEHHLEDWCTSLEIFSLWKICFHTVAAVASSPQRKTRFHTGNSGNQPMLRQTQSLVNLNMGHKLFKDNNIFVIFYHKP